ncbi:MAG: DUF6249 domain-containing protein [Patescibacteria group bacterium]
MRSLFELLFPAAMILTALSFILIMRYFIHRERMAAIARGLLPHGVMTRTTPVSIWLFRSGIIAVMGGLGVLAGLWIGLGRGPWVLGGIVPMGLGLGLILAHWLVEGEDDGGRNRGEYRENEV